MPSTSPSASSSRSARLSPANQARAAAEVLVKRGDAELERGSYESAAENFPVSAALEAKGLVERNVQSVLSTMNIPTAGDVQRLQGKIEELERVFEGLSAKIAELQQREPPPGAQPSPPN